MPPTSQQMTWNYPKKSTTGVIDMNTKYLLVHTYLSLTETKEKNRPVWRSTVNEYPEREIAHATMRESFTALFKSGIIAASFNHDCAYILLEDGKREIWTIAEVEG